ncbi:hypothetical protein ACJX0J_016466, partial [Zea mays]
MLTANHNKADCCLVQEFSLYDLCCQEIDIKQAQTVVVATAESAANASSPAALSSLIDLLRPGWLKCAFSSIVRDLLLDGYPFLKKKWYEIMQLSTVVIAYIPNRKDFVV